MFKLYMVDFITSKMLKPILVRNLVFGVEDGLVSTVGFISGIAVAGIDKSTLILSGFVLIFVEAFSMAVGSFLSESSAEEYEQAGEVSERKPLQGGLVMFFSYLFAGFLILLPYFFISGLKAVSISVLISLLTLSALGVFSAKISKTSAFKKAARMVLVGGIAIALGILIGKLFRFP